MRRRSSPARRGCGARRAHPGRTTVATNLAAELARRGAAAVLVDLDPYGGAVAQQLGILDEVSGLLSAVPTGRRRPARRAVRLRLPRSRRPPGGGHRPAPGRPVARGARRRTWSSCSSGRARTADVVVDTGFSLEDDAGSDFGGRPGRNALTLAALEPADEVVVVGCGRPGRDCPAWPAVWSSCASAAPADAGARGRSTGCAPRSGGRRRRSPAWSRASAGSPGCTSCPTTGRSSTRPWSPVARSSSPGGGAARPQPRCSGRRGVPGDARGGADGASAGPAATGQRLDRSWRGTTLSPLEMRQVKMSNSENRQDSSVGWALIPRENPECHVDYRSSATRAAGRRPGRDPRRARRKVGPGHHRRRRHHGQ